jgi:hypothetical protein
VGTLITAISYNFLLHFAKEIFEGSNERKMNGNKVGKCSKYNRTNINKSEIHIPLYIFSVSRLTTSVFQNTKETLICA